MADISITTNGTPQGTKLVVDGKDLTKNEKIVDISFYASAPFKSKYSGDVIPGYANVSYGMVDNGQLKRVTLSGDGTEYPTTIGKKVTSNDSVTRYIGTEIDANIVNLVDKIVKHCEDNKIPCIDKQILLSRSEISLKDKAADIGLKLE